MATWFRKLMSLQSECGAESLVIPVESLALSPHWKEGSRNWSMMSAVTAAAVIIACLQNEAAEAGA